MPNWCDNRLEITPNTQTNLDLFLKAISKEGTGFFNTFLPTPLELHANGGWYHWNIEHWGTKWDVSKARPQLDIDPADAKQEIAIDFDTAWAPPIALYRHLESLGYTLKATYFEGGMAFVGTYSNGADTCYNITPESLKLPEVAALLEEVGEIQYYEEEA